MKAGDKVRSRILPEHVGEVLSVGVDQHGPFAIVKWETVELVESPSQRDLEVIQ